MMSEMVASNWRKIKIGEICEVGRGSSPRPIADPRYFEGGTIPWIKIADASKSGKYLYESKEKVNEYGASFSRLMPKGTLIIAASGATLGYTQFLGVPGCIHDGWLYLHSFKGVDEHFLYYLFQWRRQHFYNMSYGAAIQNINTTILRDMEIDLPPLLIQHKISAILSTYDDLIENNMRRIKILQEMAHALYCRWFLDLRFPGHDKIKMVNSSMGQIPDGWQVLSISDLVEERIERNQIDKKLPVFSVTSARRFVLSEDYFSKQVYSKSLKNYKLVEKWDFAFNPSRINIGSIAMMDNFESGLVSPMYSVFRVRPHRITPVFLSIVLKQEPVFEQIKKLCFGTVRQTFKFKDFDHVRVLLPTSNLCKRYEEATTPILKQIECLEKKIQNLICTRDLLLPKLISGEVDVSELDIEMREPLS